MVTLNAPGFFPQGDSALTQFGFPPANNGVITRLEADGDGISEIGTVWPGSKISIAQENAPGVAASISSNHSSVNGNDGLALMALMAKLDTRYANDAAALSALIRAASNTPDDSYEKTLDALRGAILGPIGG